MQEDIRNLAHGNFREHFSGLGGLGVEGLGLWKLYVGVLVLGGDCRVSPYPTSGFGCVFESLLDLLQVSDLGDGKVESGPTYFGDWQSLLKTHIRFCEL